MRLARELLDAPAEADTIPETFELVVKGIGEDAFRCAWETGCYARGVPIEASRSLYIARHSEIRRLIVRGYVPVGTIERESGAQQSYAIVGFEPGNYMLARPGRWALERIPDTTRFVALSVDA